MADVESRNNGGEHRYEAYVDGAQAGFAAYRLTGDTIVKSPGERARHEYRHTDKGIDLGRCRSSGCTAPPSGSSDLPIRDRH